jgi:hypothetical protein
MEGDYSPLSNAGYVSKQSCTLDHEVRWLYNLASNKTLLYTEILIIKCRLVMSGVKHRILSEHYRNSCWQTQSGL